MPSSTPGHRWSWGVVTGSTVLIEVSDGSLVDPAPQPFDTQAPRGRGLQFVDALARTWSWRTEGNGKTVWAVMTAIDQREQISSGLAGHGNFLPDSHQVEQAKQPGRAPGDAEVDCPQSSSSRGEKQRGDPTGIEKSSVHQLDVDTGSLRRRSQSLVEAFLEGRRGKTIDLAV